MIPVRVVLADDHPPTRLGVRRVLEDVGFEVVGECSDGPTAVELVAAHQPELCVLDLHMPRGDGLDALPAILAAAPTTAVVVLTVSSEDEDLLRALRLGASGYLLKDMDPDRLGAALLGVMEGEAAIPRALVSRVLTAYRGSSRMDRRLADLSQRERTVLEMLAAGSDTGAVARALVVEPVTIRTHVRSAVRKLGVVDRAAAIAVVTDEG